MPPNTNAAGPKRRAARRRFGIRPVLPAVLRQMFGRTTIASRPELVERWRTRFLHVHVPSVLNGLGMLSGRDDVTGRLRQIAVPTLVIVGEEDRALPPAKSRAIAAGIPGARLVTVPGAGHLPCVETPAAYAAILAPFLKEHAHD